VEGLVDVSDFDQSHECLVLARVVSA